MAVTGLGTEENPFIVHSYDEIKSCIEGLNDDQLHYLKLGNNIDCKDYGESFEWATISVNWSNRRFDFDLNGHTIQNVKIGTNQTMFIYSGQASRIHDGKLLNIFLDQSYGLTAAYGGVYADFDFENISISVSGMGLKSNHQAFQYIRFKKCAVYYETNVLNSDHEIIINNDLGGGGANVINSDIIIKCDNQNQRYFFNSEVKFEACRIRGYTKGSAPYAGNYNNQRCTFKNSFTSCIFEFDNSEYVGYAPTFIIGFDANSGCVINKDIIAVVGSSWNFVTTEQIRNGSALRSAGFPVINVQP